jgi:hypothetical protein
MASGFTENTGIVSPSRSTSSMLMNGIGCPYILKLIMIESFDIAFILISIIVVGVSTWVMFGNKSAKVKVP